MLIFVDYRAIIVQRNQNIRISHSGQQSILWFPLSLFQFPESRVPFHWIVVKWKTPNMEYIAQKIN